MNTLFVRAEKGRFWN